MKGLPKGGSRVVLGVVVPEVVPGWFSPCLMPVPARQAEVVPDPPTHTKYVGWGTAGCRFIGSGGRR